MDPRALRRTFLWLFIGCLGLTALLAILAVLSGGFGDFQTRILASSASISAASVCAMACAAFRERGRLPRLGTAGIALVGIALALVLACTWVEHPGKALVKTALLFVVHAVSTAHGELLLLPALAPRYRWVQTAAIVAIALLALQLSVLIVWQADDDVMLRLIGVTSIVVALTTLVVPILWKIGGESHARLVLRQVADGAWVDGTGARYEVRRLAGDEAPE
ncbi:MAG: hypothetical protein KDC98_00635 [Planctomycetes bacterium]|nr:hypothetical protein [Planctomycetota bacterium]